MDSVGDTRALPRVGFPIRKSSGQRLFAAYRSSIAAYRVLHRLLAPRHPPYALSSLTILGSWRTAGIRGLAAPDLRNHASPQVTASLRKATVCGVFSCQKSFGAAPRPPAVAPREPLVPRSATAEARRARPGDDSHCGSFPRVLRYVPACRLALRDRLRRSPAPDGSVPTLRSPAAPGLPGWRVWPGRCRCVCCYATGRHLVENTGLEPVTSWLQTRRSPS